MEQILDFVVENYIWIIIIGIVIIMTIIGYIADKTDFGKESFKKSKKEKINKEVEEQNEMVVNEIPRETVMENVEAEMPIEETVTTENLNEPETISFDTQNINSIEELPVDEVPMEENVIPAFDTNELMGFEEMPMEENLSSEIAPEIQEQPVEQLDKKTLKRMQKEEAKRLKEEAKKLKEEEKRLKKESKNKKNQEMEQVTESIYTEEVPAQEENVMENEYREEVPVQEEPSVFEEVQENTSDIFEPMEDVIVDIPNQDLNDTTVENINVENDNIEVSTDNSTESSNEETADGIEDIPEIELPSIESLDNELEDYEEDDVWKF